MTKLSTLEHATLCLIAHHLATGYSESTTPGVSGPNLMYRHVGFLLKLVERVMSASMTEPADEAAHLRQLLLTTQARADKFKALLTKYWDWEGIEHSKDCDAFPPTDTFSGTCDCEAGPIEEEIDAIVNEV